MEFALTRAVLTMGFMMFWTIWNRSNSRNSQDKQEDDGLFMVICMSS